MLNIAIIGIGYWGPNILRSFAKIENVNIKYICDLNENKLNKLKELYPKSYFIKNANTIFEDNSIDAVIIVTSANTHFKLAKQALLSNKHVFVEKPLTLTKKDSQELVTLAEQQNKKLMVGHLLLYHPAITFLKKYITDGKLGKISYIYTARLNLGKVRSEENAFWSLAPHDLSIILYLLEKEPISIYANGESFIREGIEDVVFSYLKFNDNLSAHIHVSWLDPHKLRKITIIGTKGMAVFDDMDTEKIKIYDKSIKTQEEFDFYDDEYISIQNGEYTVPKLDTTEPLLAECQDFVNSIKNNTTPLANGKEGLKVVAILEEVDNLLKTKKDLTQHEYTHSR